MEENNIPIDFLKYLKGYDDIEYAVLKRAGREWQVKVNGHRFEEGWKEFAEEHDLQLGDLLIFRRDGNMDFEVTTIFDSTHCEREYADFFQQEGKNVEEEEEDEEDEDEADEEKEDEEDEDEADEEKENEEDEEEEDKEDDEEEDEEEAHIVEENSKDFEFKGKPKPKIKTSGKVFSNVEAAKDMNLSHSHFICTIRPYSLAKYCLCIPKQFAQENGLNDRTCMIIVRDKQQSWTFGMYTSGRNTFIGSGWHEFCITNCLKKGDRLMFEIVSNGDTPIFRFHDLRGSPSLQPEAKKKKLDAERMSDKVTAVRLKTSDVTTPESQIAASTSADANPHFMSTIQPYTLRFPVLYLPMAFAKSNGLLNRRELILVDEREKLWSVWLGRIDNRHFGIKRGWPQFRQANGVQVGDTYKFELTKNGAVPIVHFHTVILT